MTDPCGPAMHSCCTWPVDTTCAANWPADRTCWTPQHELAAQQASEMLRALTGGRYGLCHVLVRPCRQQCSDDEYSNGDPYGSYGGPYGAGPIRPLNLGGGQWINLVCGGGCASDCSCTPLCEMELPSPVAEVVEVKQNGVVLSPNAYRVDEERYLVRIDGQCWPWCQDLTKPDTQPDTLSVRYLIGRRVPLLGVVAHTALAAELYKKCVGDRACRLPGRVTQVVREGVTYDLLDPREWLDLGLTGLDEVDRWLKIVNPRSLRTPPAVLSPDFRRQRMRRLAWDQVTPSAPFVGGSGSGSELLGGPSSPGSPEGGGGRG